MSPLARRVAAVTAILLAVQLVGELGVLAALTAVFRPALVSELYSGVEGAGLLADCEARPGPWATSTNGWTAWPLAADGRLVGDDPPIPRVALPPPGEAVRWSGAGMVADVYASSSPGCGGVAHVLPWPLPVLGAGPAPVVFVLSRLLLAMGIALALVAATAVPLVRRIRVLSTSMGRIVDAGFDGGIDDPSTDELGDVARAFDAAAASVREQLGRLEHRDAVLRRALADFAHDLRTPLTTLQLSVSGLSATPASARMRSELAYLLGMTQNLESLLDGDGDGEVVPVALDHLLERIRHRFAPLVGDRGVSFDVALPDESLHAQADPVVLERAVGNLVHNALRFARGHVVVLLFRDGDEVRVEVRDDGPGFGPSLDRAAERGVRGDQTDGVGFGLGLAIAEAAARRFGGRLELRDDEEGTLAAVVLPAA